MIAGLNFKGMTVKQFEKLLPWNTVVDNIELFSCMGRFIESVDIIDREYLKSLNYVIEDAWYQEAVDGTQLHILIMLSPQSIKN